MSLSKRDFHDLSDEEDLSGGEDQSHEDSRFSSLPNKRRRIAAGAVEDNDLGSASDSELADHEDHADEDDVHERSKAASDSTFKPIKVLTLAEAAATQRKASKTGVVYISRVPPFMKPATVRKLLAPYGTVGRVFLTPESAPAHQRRVRAGGNKKKSFVDGWVEFLSKKRAKDCVEFLNGNTIGGKKGGFYHDDIWNLKYLKGFKWSDLMEQVQNEERSRVGRLNAELAREKREREAFLENLGFEQRSKKKREKAAVDDGGEGAEEEQARGKQEQVETNVAANTGQKKAFERRFKQNEVKLKTASDGPRPENVERVLKSIF